MSGFYINFRFKNLIYDDDFICGAFEACDENVYCEFEYNRHTEETKIWNNNQPVESITPIPIWWLKWKLKETGKLDDVESKISY